jgi:hypothetical protein
MSVREIISFLADWKRPSDDPIGQSPEGLGRELTSLVASEPTCFAEKADRFRQLDPTYVRSFISGVLGAAKQSKSFPWSPVFTLCRWVLKQPREIPGRENYTLDQDKDWLGTRAEIADLFSTGFKAGDAEIPFAHRTSVWRILKQLTDDPHPTPEDEERQGGSEMDPATYSINTIRGEAMHALMRYALWVQRHVKEEKGEEEAALGFEVMPEVRKTLDYHLDPRRDPSLAIRSVYGQWLPWLIMIDQTWVEQNLPRIFPADENLRQLRDAAWDTYVRFNEAYTNIFEVLRGEYHRAIERLGEERKRDGRNFHKPNQHLASHLMLLYGRGKLDLNDPEGPLTRFYEKAPDKLCAHALWYIGCGLSEAKEDLPTAILEAVQNLWQRRLSVARNDGASHNGGDVCLRPPVLISEVR